MTVAWIDSSLKKVKTDPGPRQRSENLKFSRLFLSRFRDSCSTLSSAGLEVETAYVLANSEGYFALVGKTTDTRWIEQGAVFVTADEEDLGEDELDFESM